MFEQKLNFPYLGIEVEGSKLHHFYRCDGPIKDLKEHIRKIEDEFGKKFLQNSCPFATGYCLNFSKLFGVIVRAGTKFAKNYSITFFRPSGNHVIDHIIIGHEEAHALWYLRFDREFVEYLINNGLSGPSNLSWGPYGHMAHNNFYSLTERKKMHLEFLCDCAGIFGAFKNKIATNSDLKELESALSSKSTLKHTLSFLSERDYFD